MDIYNAFAAGPLLVDTINFLTAMLQTPASQADKVLERKNPQFACLSTHERSLQPMGSAEGRIWQCQLLAPCPPGC